MFQNSRVYVDGVAIMSVNETTAIYNGQQVAVDSTETQQAVALFNNAVVLDGQAYEWQPAGNGGGGGGGNGGQGQPPAGFDQVQNGLFIQLVTLRQQLLNQINGYQAQRNAILAERDQYIRNYGGIESVRTFLVGWLETARRLGDIEQQRALTAEIQRLDPAVTAFRAQLNEFNLRAEGLQNRIALASLKYEEVTAAINAMIDALGNGQPIPLPPEWVLNPNLNGGPNTTLEQALRNRIIGILSPILFPPPLLPPNPYQGP